MVTHTAAVEWRRDGQAFIDNRYSRAHEWRFDGGATVKASSSPHSVRVPFSEPSHVDPEEAFIAAISSCHMLWFLSFAAQADYVVDRYVDEARGEMQTRPDGVAWVARAVLSPVIRFTGTKAPDEAAVTALHHKAHASCNIAHSARTEISVEPTWSFEPAKG
jgi:organic hydroperoxide reductase OsmC/OhrA